MPERPGRTRELRELGEAASSITAGAARLTRALRSVDQLSGLTDARLSALGTLVYRGPQTLGELAAAESVSGPTMTRIVDGLVTSGLVQRAPHPSDGRSVVVVPTAHGAMVMNAASARRRRAVAGALRGVGLAEQQLLGEAGPVLGELAQLVEQEAALRSES